jgi:hypothetical protein
VVLVLQGALAADVAAVAVEAALGVGQVVGEDLPQPGRPLGVAGALELFEGLAGFQQRLLHHVGGVDAGPSAQMKVGQREQV